MAAPLLPLENGPSTIFNQKPALIDPVALEVGRMLETHSQVLRTQGNLELEVRLGILKSVKSSSAPLNSRVDLPILSEAMLIPRCEEFHYRFQAGLPPEIYAALLQKLEIMRRDHHVEPWVKGRWWKGSKPPRPAVAPLERPGRPRTTL
eukprot:g28603.t1